MKLFNFFRKKDKKDLKFDVDNYYVVVDEKSMKLYDVERDTFYDLLVDDRTFTKEDLASLYEKLSWIYAGIRAIANAFSILDFKIVKKDKVSGEMKEVEVDHPVAELLERPNPDMSFSDFMEAIAIQLESLGECFIEIVSDFSGKPVALYPLLSYRMSIVLDNSMKNIKAFVYRTGRGNFVEFKKDEIIYIKYSNPLSDLIGFSSLLPLKTQVEVERYAMKHLKSFFKNGAIPGGVLKVDKVLTDEQYKRILQRWESVHRGADKHYRIAVLEAGADYKDIALSFRDAELINIRKLDREEILAVLGVPHALVGLRENANYATLNLERKLFWEDKIIPKLKKIEGAINRQLIPKFRTKNVKFKFDLDKVPALKESLETRARVARMLTDGGILKINEVRRELFNKPPVDWGDTWYQPLNLIPVDSGRKPENPGGRGKPGLSNTKPTSGGKSDKKSFDLEDYFVFRDTWIHSFVEHMKPFFEEQRSYVKEVVDNYVPFGIASKAEYLELLPILLREIDNALYRNKDAMIDAYFNFFVKCITRSGSNAMFKLYEKGWVNDYVFLPNPDEIKELGDEWGEVFAVEVNATTFDELKKALESDEILSNVSFTSISGCVYTVFERIVEKLSEKQNRIEKMANTEFNGIWNCGIWLAGKQANIPYKVWKCFGDNPRESHKKLDGVAIKIDERFTVGESKGRFPSDWLLSPNERINCYCSIELKKEV